MISCLHTSNASANSGRKASNCLAVAVVLLPQITGRVFCKLIGCSNAGYTSISSIQFLPCAIERLRTEERNYASRPSDDAHGSNILLPEGVLHAGDDGTDGRGLEGRARCIREGVLRMVGGVLVGHGGRNGASVSVCQVPGVVEVGVDGLGKQTR